MREAEESLQSTDSYFSNLLNAIIDNLQISIEKVHCRYEDNSNSKFGIGITLGELSAVSCTSDWRIPAAEKKSKETVFKLIQMNSFAIYCESNSTSYTNGTDQERNARFFDNVSYLIRSLPNQKEKPPINVFWIQYLHLEN